MLLTQSYLLFCIQFNIYIELKKTKNNYTKMTIMIKKTERKKNPLHHLLISKVNM